MHRAIEVHPPGHWPPEAALDTVTLAYVDRHRAALLRIAWHLGNRHLPLQVTGERLRIRADHVIADMVTGLGGRVTRLQAPFDPEIGAYAAATHHEHE